MIYLVLLTSSASSFRVNMLNNPTESSEPRTIDRNFKLMYDLYKILSDSKAKPNDKNYIQHKHEIIPYNGLYVANPHRKQIHTIEKFKTLADLNREEGIMDMPMQAMKDAEMKNKDPQFGLFDKFSKKVDLVLLTKIFLKVIIFKSVVKFIALLCLLFFIPALNSEDARGFNATRKNEKKDFLKQRKF